ncbi:MAG: primase [Gammaproteobacteria bacterium]|jgi:DNA primase|nr:primase [Gammaproteobacteria bacterium]
MAGRIPQDFIHSLLARADIVEVIDSRVSLKKKGTNYQACCPFHQEKSPSFTVSPTKQFYYCFGCGAHGNAISFLTEYEHLEFVEAVEELAKLVGMPVPYEAGSAPKENKDSLSPIYSVLEQASKFYQKELRQNETAIAYLKQRGLSGIIAKEFGIGYSPSGWDNLNKAINADAKQTESLEQAGLLIKKDQNKFYDRFRNRIMFPIRDKRGRTIGFGGRVIDKNDNPKYLNSPETPVFHKGQGLYGIYEAKQALSHFDNIIVVEGYMDVIGLAQADIRYAVATLGTATTQDHLRILFKESSVVTFCFDGDRAGRQAAWRALQIALSFMTGEYHAYFLFLPEEEDPDTLVQKEGKAAFEARLKKALPLSTYLLEQLKSKVNLSTVEGRSKLLTLAIPFLKQLPEGPYYNLLCEEVAKHCQISTRQIMQHITGQAPQEQVKTEKNQGKTLNIVEQAIALLIQEPDLAGSVNELKLNPDFPEQALLQNLLSFIKQHNPPNTGAILEHWKNSSDSKNIAQFATVKYQINLENKIQEFTDIISRISEENDKIVLENLLMKAKSGELSSGDKENLKNFLQKFKK